MKSSDDNEDKYLADLLEGLTFNSTDPTDDSEWTDIITEYPTDTIGIDDVDTNLLKKARREVETVKNNFMLQIFGAEQNQ